MTPRKASTLWVPSAPPSGTHKNGPTKTPPPVTKDQKPRLLLIHERGRIFQQYCNTIQRCKPRRRSPLQFLYHTQRFPERNFFSSRPVTEHKAAKYSQMPFDSLQQRHDCRGPSHRRRHEPCPAVPTHTPSQLHTVTPWLTSEGKGPSASASRPQEPREPGSTRPDLLKPSRFHFIHLESQYCFFYGPLIWHARHHCGALSWQLRFVVLSVPQACHTHDACEQKYIHTCITRHADTVYQLQHGTQATCAAPDKLPAAISNRLPSSAKKNEKISDRIYVSASGEVSHVHHGYHPPSCF